ncbi:TonB-dependent receptor [Niabella sp. W65]|nr:TonB-dependent receptor [Niabella sp. W65]MCH7364425.1 TonB-dependent receptor [Niabella sp. W65]ULT40289.1 TonB-dependent receptor [Niabella sp. I65]
MTDLKFRGSYGSLGNQNVGTDLWLRLYSTTQQVNYIFGGTRPVGVNPPGLIDPNLTWETATTLDLGLDATLFRKLNINFRGMIEKRPTYWLMEKNTRPYWVQHRLSPTLAC